MALRKQNKSVMVIIPEDSMALKSNKSVMLFSRIQCKKISGDADNYNYCMLVVLVLGQFISTMVAISCYVLDSVCVCVCGHVRCVRVGWGCRVRSNHWRSLQPAMRGSQDETPDTWRSRQSRWLCPVCPPALSVCPSSRSPLPLGACTSLHGRGGRSKQLSCCLLRSTTALSPAAVDERTP